MTKPVAIDFFCCAGGMTRGLQQAGFRVIGVDIVDRPNYIGDDFVKGDALVLGADLIRKVHPALVTGSPPCQRFTVGAKQHGTQDSHPDLIPATREMFIGSGVPYVIENVAGAPLLSPTRLCGSMFGMKRLRRHRLFESSLYLPQMSCDHQSQRDVVSVAGNPGGSSRRDGSSRFGSVATWREIMGIDWMTGKELAQAIPPAYGRWIGAHALGVLADDPLAAAH